MARFWFCGFFLLRIVEEAHKRMQGNCLNKNNYHSNKSSLFRFKDISFPSLTIFCVCSYCAWFFRIYLVFQTICISSTVAYAFVSAKNSMSRNKTALQVIGSAFMPNNCSIFSIQIVYQCEIYCYCQCWRSNILNFIRFRCIQCTSISIFKYLDIIAYESRTFYRTN